MWPITRHFLTVMLCCSILTPPQHNSLANTPISLPAKPIIHFHIIYARVTAYSKRETCPTRTCITASGTIAIARRTLACPTHVRMGTTVVISGQSYICEDRTSSTYNGRWDIFFGNSDDDYQRARAFGIKTLAVTIYD